MDTVRSKNQLFKKRSENLNKTMSVIQRKKEEAKKQKKKRANILAKSLSTMHFPSEDDYLKKPFMKKKKRSKPKRKIKIYTDENLKGIRVPSFMKSICYPPTEVVIEDDGIPYNLEVEYVYGSSRKGCTGKLVHINKHGRMVYAAASIGVSLDVKENNQQHFVKHADDMTCIAMHPKKEIFASGETGDVDYVYVWNSKTMELIASLNTSIDFDDGGVIGVAFSKGGKYLWVIGGCVVSSTLQLWDWKRKTKLCEAVGAKSLTHGIYCNPVCGRLIWLGDAIKFFSFDKKNLRLSSKMGIASAKVRKKTKARKGGRNPKLYDCCFDKKGKTYVATHSGNVFVFEENGIRMVYKRNCHPKQNCYAIHKLDNDQMFVTGGTKDVRIWKFHASKFFTPIKTIYTGHDIGSIVQFDDELLYTMSREDGCFTQINMSTNDQHVIMYSHQGLGTHDELWGLDNFPKDNDFFMTGGDDGKVVLYSKEQCKTLGAFKVPKERVRSVAVHPTSVHFAVGTVSGKICVYLMNSLFNARTPVLLKEMQCGKGIYQEELKVMRYSPDGKFLAAGSNNNWIYIFAVGRKYERYCILKGHSSYITGLDWSANSNFMQAVSGSYEVLYFDVINRKRIGYPSLMRDMEWATQTCILGWSVKGIWDMSVHNDGTDINNCHANFEKGIVASVDDDGRVQIHKYPTVKDKPQSKRYIGHCSHVTCCRAVGNHVISIGGGDMTTIQWRLVPCKVEKQKGGEKKKEPFRT